MYLEGGRLSRESNILRVNIVKVGFTGTRDKLEYSQVQRIEQFLNENLDDIEVCIHGGCLGADFIFHTMCKALKLKTEVYPGHPKYNEKDVSMQANIISTIRHEAKPFLWRNQDIVDGCDILIACPKDMSKKGGTWYTIHYCQKRRKPVKLFLPMGQIND